MNYVNNADDKYITSISGIGTSCLDQYSDISLMRNGVYEKIGRDNAVVHGEYNYEAKQYLLPDILY